jgi:long-chain acyl-CoA synthetase
MLFGAAAYAECSGLRTATSQVSYLPLTHVVQRACSLYLAAYTTAHTHLCADPQRLLEHLRTARPQLFFAVRRIWEKLAAGLRALRAAGHHDAAALTAVGLDHCDDAVTGAAGLANEVFDELRSFGLPLVTAYGLTETAGAVTRDDPAHPAPDTVGRAEPGVEVRVAHDGEVLLRGPTVMRGYLGRPAETAAVLDPGGWLHTGDLGKIRRDGRLTIVGRKKEIIVTSGGKNIMPTAVEMLLTRHPLIGQALVCGDGHPYLVALLTLDPDADRPADVDATLAKAVAEANAQLSRPEQVKRWMVLNQPWTIEQGAITPTLKLRRTVLTEQHADDIASLYDCQRLSAEGHSSWSGIAST